MKTMLCLSKSKKMYANPTSAIDHGPAADSGNAMTAKITTEYWGAAGTQPIDTVT